MSDYPLRVTTHTKKLLPVGVETGKNGLAVNNPKYENVSSEGVLKS